MRSALFSTPRPEPGHLLPAVAGGGTVALALPVFLLSGWSLAGWALAAVLWIAVHGLEVLLARLKTGRDNLAGSGVQAFGLFFKAIAVLVVLLAAAGSNPRLALAAALTYGFAYTLELGISLLSYFGSPA